MAKRNFSALVEESLKGREIGNITPQEQKTELVNGKTSNVSLSDSISNTNNQKADNNIENRDIDKNVAKDFDNEKSLQNNFQTSSEESAREESNEKETRTVKRQKVSQNESKFIASTWVPKEYMEKYEAAATIYKNGAKYTLKLIIKDLDENGDKYLEIAKKYKEATKMFDEFN